MPGVERPDRAHSDYMLKCQGCHRQDGSGDDFTNPPMKDVLAKFLHVEGGREFLVRVPGVSTSDLDDERLTDVLNWSLYRFDPGHMPADFKPYTTREVSELRRRPLRTERVTIRQALINKMPK